MDEVPEDRSYPMTNEALEELRAELKHLAEVERPALADRLKMAIELGDLAENADYISAKEDQGFLEGRIQQLELMIRYAVIIEATGNDGTVQLGNRVTVLEEGGDEAETFLIVGQVEANPVEGKISHESPLGNALVGKHVGDIVHVEAPSGELSFKIIRID